MSISTEISRIQGAKANLKTSIEAKGVTVPSSTLISGYANLVDQISSGSGLPDSDGLVSLAIGTVDMTVSASSLTLTYTPTYLLRYSPLAPMSNLNTMEISKTVHYPNIVWTCNKPSITINGNTATIPIATNEDAMFTATWTDYTGDTRTTSKSIHLMNLAYVYITIAESLYAVGQYFVTNEYPPNIGINTYEEYKFMNYICTGTSTPPYYGGYSVLSNNGTTAAIFNSIAAAKAAIDSM